MDLFRNPDWISSIKLNLAQTQVQPEVAYQLVNKKLEKLISEEPFVSVVIAAWNEELNILNCIASLAETETSIPMEIVVVNNNSTDRTQLILDKLNVRSFFQGVQGWGPARQMGLENARGKYILLADADSFYPKSWLNEMVRHLLVNNVVCVYGRYSFISEPGYPRWKLFLLEKLRDTLAAVKQINRPYLNAYGISMGYITAYGLKVGYVMTNIRGEDGRFCFDLMKFGKVRQVTAKKARVWTNVRTLRQDGSINQALWLRIKSESRRIFTLFRRQEAHDTKTSKN